MEYFDYIILDPNTSGAPWQARSRCKIHPSYSNAGIVFANGGTDWEALENMHHIMAMHVREHAQKGDI